MGQTTSFGNFDKALPGDNVSFNFGTEPVSGVVDNMDMQDGHKRINVIVGSDMIRLDDNNHAWVGKIWRQGETDDSRTWSDFALYPTFGHIKIGDSVSFLREEATVNGKVFYKTRSVININVDDGSIETIYDGDAAKKRVQLIEREVVEGMMQLNR